MLIAEKMLTLRSFQFQEFEGSEFGILIQSDIHVLV